MPVTYWTEDEVEQQSRRLTNALRGGNELKDNADLFEMLADRLVNVHGEDPGTDYIKAARLRAIMIQSALKGYRP